MADGTVAKYALRVTSLPLCQKKGDCLSTGQKYAFRVTSFARCFGFFGSATTLACPTFACGTGISRKPFCLEASNLNIGAHNGECGWGNAVIDKKVEECKIEWMLKIARSLNGCFSKKWSRRVILAKARYSRGVPTSCASVGV